MSIFHLPDLGEGLPDAEIHQWYVKVGDEIKLDDPLVAMETAKAVVDVPAPQAGTIIELYGQPGDIIKTGSPLVRFSTEEKPSDSGTVVGKLEEDINPSEDNFIIGHADAHPGRIIATPAVRLLAKKKNVDLSIVKGSGSNGLITQADIENAAQSNQILSNNSQPDGFVPLRGVRRTMCQAMTLSHQQVVPVTLHDEVDIYLWGSQTDLTLRLIRAIAEASTIEPSLNAWFNESSLSRQCFKEVNIGIAVDSDAGLVVPVLPDVSSERDASLREKINYFKKAVEDRELSPDNLKGATITLSNFGKFAGRFATPIVVPPTVAIIAVGKTYQGVVAMDGQVVVHPLLPLSLTFDHRAVTGGEATRFFNTLIKALLKA